MSTLQQQLEEARADLAALTSTDLPKFEALLEQRAREESDLRRQVKEGKAKPEQLVEARYKREGAESILVEHRQDIAALQAEVSRLKGQIDRAEKQAHFDELVARQVELATSWQDKAKETGQKIATALNALYDLECEASINSRAVNEATQALGINPPAWTPPDFSLTPLLLSVLQNARHVGGGTITFEPNPAYRVTLQPRLRGWRA